MKSFKSYLMLLIVGALPALPGAPAVRQAELCMIGDSITWAGNGDCFRQELLKQIPDLAFVGTHSAKFGYSHAGEGGNTASAIIKRIDNKLRVPDSANYHVLCGINDSAATRSPAEIQPNAQKISKRIFTIIDHLLARPTTKKVFVGTILPCYFEPKLGAKMLKRYQYRDQTGAAINVILRRELPKRYAANKVVMIEYEKPLRAIPDWQHLIYLHPTPAGYAKVATLAANVMRSKLHYTTLPRGTYGVEVINLYDNVKGQTSPLIPGWYTLSFEAKNIRGKVLEIELQAIKNPPKKLRFALKKTLKVPVKATKRLFVNFMTGYEGYGYSETAITIRPVNGEISQIMLEKMRPHQKPSAFVVQQGIDTTQVAPIRGEKLIIVK